jgi:hypothetical protein
MGVSFLRGPDVRPDTVKRRADDMTTTKKTAKKTARIPRNPERIDWSGRVDTILSGNAKLEKTPFGVPAVACGISMAPAKRSGVVNVCEFATAACIAACVLWFAGRTMTAVVRAAAIARTMLWHFSPDVFYSRLRRELAKFAAACTADNVRGFVRLNTASDIDHGTELQSEFPTLTMYDYTKSVERVMRYLRGFYPSNYHISLSVHESSTFSDVNAVLSAGGNVVVVVDSYYWGPSKRYGTLPAQVVFTGPDGSRITVPAVDGDISDIRTPEFDGRGVAVCLRLKSQSNKVKDGARRTGFARPWTLGGKEHSQRFEIPAARGTMVARLK